MNSFTGRLKSKMKEFDLTQEELARKLSITRSAVAHYLQGTRHPPLKTVVKLAAILKTDPLGYNLENLTKPKNQAANKLKNIKTVFLYLIGNKSSIITLM